MQTSATDFTTSRSLKTKLLAIFTWQNSRRQRNRPAAAVHARDYSHPPYTDCGGYNEAFVIQYWTGYNPRH